MLFKSGLVILFWTGPSVDALAFNEKPSTLHYRYFAFGSNLVETTMTALRGLEPIDATAAILPGYSLRFNIPGSPKLEPSAAAVEPTTEPEAVVHGVLYTLTEADFERVGQTEGVPFGYRWQSCQVVPYVGDGNDAGQRALQRAVRVDPESSSTRGGNEKGAKNDVDNPFLTAYTLVAGGSVSSRDIPPSKSYLGLLIEGAKKFRMDQSYVEKLESTPYARDLLFPDGLAGTSLKLAELRKGINSRRRN